MRDEFDSSRKTQYPACHDSDNDEADSAQRVVAKSVERDRQCYTCRSTSHHNLDHQTNTGNNFKRSSTDDTAHVDNIDDVRVLSVELEEFVGSIGRERFETDDGNDAGDDTENLKTARKRQDTKADLVGDEDEDGIPLSEGSVVLAALVEDVLDRLIGVLFLGSEDIVASIVDGVDFVTVDAADGRRTMVVVLAHFGLRLCGLVLSAHDM